MASGFLAAMAMLAEPVYGPPAPPPPPAAAKAAPKPAQGCDAARPTNEREIVVCAQRPQGYRLNPDVLEAKRELHNGGPAKRPESFKDNNCASVGPMACQGQGMAGIDLINAATVLGTMVARAIKGQNVGRMFITDPQPSEYQLYLEAKHRREAREAEQAAAAKAKAAAAIPAPAAGK
jgi:hypothetical protein